MTPRLIRRGRDDRCRLERGLENRIGRRRRGWGAGRRSGTRPPQAGRQGDRLNRRLRAKGPASTDDVPDPPRATLLASGTNGEERDRRRDREDEAEVVPLEVPPEEEEREKREGVARQQRRDRRPAPQPHEPPRGDRRGDGDLDRGEREVRLAVLDDAEGEEQCGKAHARDRIGPGGAASVVAHDVVVERGEVVHQERHEGRREDEGRRPGGPPQRGPGLADGARAPRCYEIDRDEGQDEERVQLRRAGDREREGRERAPLALEQEHGAEEWQEHEEVVAPLDDEREELRVEGDYRGEREARAHVAVVYP